jgi:hypothetical protein
MQQLEPCMKITGFWDVPLCSLVDIHTNISTDPVFSIFIIGSTLKVEAELVNMYQTTQCHPMR